MWIRDGKVEVNGRIVTDPATWVVVDQDRIALDGRAVGPRVGLPLVVLFNKPRGVLVTARDPEGRTRLGDALPEPYRSDASLRPVGRLDRDTGGLLVLTDSNDLAARLTDSRRNVPKLYRVKVTGRIDRTRLARLAAGVDIGDATPTRPARVAIERTNPSSKILRIEIVEGRNRQVKRMVEAMGCRVEWLVRIAFGPVELGGLGFGQAREASRIELECLLGSAGLSGSDA